MFLNSKKQGDWGLGQAIGYFSSIGWTVSIPLTDSQDYDLIVDNGTQLLKIQVKTTTYKRYASYHVNMSTQGGNKSSNTIKHFNPMKTDFVFVITADNVKYLIPSEILPITKLVLHAIYDKYKIHADTAKMMD